MFNRPYDYRTDIIEDILWRDEIKKDISFFHEDDFRIVETYTNTCGE